MIFADKLTLDAPRRLEGGYMVVRAKAARSGVYQYAGSEVDPTDAHGLRDQATVNVLREPDVVFDRKAVHSFIGKPITDNHPSVAVDASNWRDHARGVVMGAMKDGEHLSFDLLLTDQSAIDAVDGGKRELSNGYAADIEFGDYIAPDGTACQARQTSIKGNHVALVDRGRAGSECRIADAKPCVSLPADVFELLTDSAPYGDVEYADPGYQSDGKKRYPVDTEEHIRAAWNYIHKKENADKYSSADLAKVKERIVAAWKSKIDKAGPPAATGDERTYSPGPNDHKNEPARRETSNSGGSQVATKTITFDGLPLEVTDAAEAAITKLQGQLKDATDGRAADKAAHDKALGAKDAEIEDLKKKVVDQAKIDQLADAKAAVVADAKKIAGDKLADTAGKSVAEVRRMAVAAVLGDSAVADKSDDYIEARFDHLKDGKAETRDPMRDALAGGAGKAMTYDNSSVRDLARVSQYN